MLSCELACPLLPHVRFLESHTRFLCSRQFFCRVLFFPSAARFNADFLRLFVFYSWERRSKRAKDKQQKTRLNGIKSGFTLHKCLGSYRLQYNPIRYTGLLKYRARTRRPTVHASQQIEPLRGHKLSMNLIIINNTQK